MSRLIYIFIFCFALLARAAEDPNDSYDFQVRCPKEGAMAEANFATNPYYQDGRTFPICQCTSYVSFKLNQLWGNTNPRFTNQYYVVQDGEMPMSGIWQHRNQRSVSRGPETILLGMCRVTMLSSRGMLLCGREKITMSAMLPMLKPLGKMLTAKV